MRRLRALWKFRRSANIAAMIGQSWVRRANEIRYGRAIELLQAIGRGYVARLRARRRLDSRSDGELRHKEPRSGETGPPGAAAGARGAPCCPLGL